MMERYAELFSAYYTGEVPPGWLPEDQHSRFRVDSIRRRLDLLSRVREQFPLTSYVANALMDERFLLGVCEHFPQATRATSSLSRAVAKALEAWVAGQDARIEALHAYESLLLVGLRPWYEGPWKEALRERGGLPERFLLAEFSLDVLALAEYVGFLAHHVAPDSFVRETVGRPRRQVLAAYPSGNSMLARDVTALVDSIVGRV
ncbi:hypothetical protein [Cystobacter fuscus]|uniref:hypothetical protein n=1 Tax=Cystobacter fuscus TaxID=43 RepID=UPI002B2920D3|nr:hypothetical protein F0U63_32075 [Cystobacter fuscus]